jgi:hypothetical protein
MLNTFGRKPIVFLSLITVVLAIILTIALFATNKSSVVSNEAQTIETAKQNQASQVSPDLFTAYAQSVQNDASSEYRFMLDTAAQTYQIESQNWVQQNKLIIHDEANYGGFGYSVSMSGDGLWAIVGAPGKDNLQGAAYVFRQTATGWALHQKLLASDPTNGINFGQSVFLSTDGKTALVGASGENAAYVFIQMPDATWQQQQKLVAEDATNSDKFGEAVALDKFGNTALIGAYGKNNNQGAAYVFSRTNNNWGQQQKLTASDGASSHKFGWSVALSGNGDTALIGRMSNQTSGSAYVYTRSGSVWTEQQKLVPNPQVLYQYFGYSVALSGDGNTALITDWGGPNNSNKVAVSYIRNGTNWQQHGRLDINDSDNFTHYIFSLALSDNGDAALVGAPMYNNGDGATYVFRYVGTGWQRSQKLLPADLTSNGQFGQSVALNSAGTVGIIGSYRQNNNQGAAYVFSSTLTPLTTALYLSITPFNSITVGQAVTFTTTISPTDATGTVTFTIGSATATTNVVTSTATYITNTLAAGSYTITAQYGGDTNYTPSSSNSVSLTVETACNPLVVTAVVDDGTGNICGTLSHALSQPVATTPVTITFALSNGDNVISFTGALSPTLKTGVVLQGKTSCEAANVPIILLGNGNVGGLRLEGNNTLIGLSVQGFAARQIQTISSGNRLLCTIGRSS